MSGTEVTSLLDAVLKSFGLRPGGGRPGYGPAAPFAAAEAAPLVRLFQAVHERNLASCDSLTPRDDAPDHLRSIADLDEALACPPPSGGPHGSPGRLVAEVSSRYIDLQYAMNGARGGGDVLRINALLDDLVAAKVKLVTSVEAARAPTPPAPPAEALARPYLDI